jgi:hypothetical protein
MNSEFLRMQKLAGVKPVQEDYNEIVGILTEVYLHNHYYSKGILKENINNLVIEGIIDDIKNKFSKLPTKTKQVTKKVVDAVKKIGSNPVEIIKDLSSLKPEQFKSSQDFLDTFRAVQTLSLRRNLNEAEGIQTFTDIKQLKDLKPGDEFIWKGKEDPKAKWNDEPITINAAKDQYGLKPNLTYIVQPEEDWEGGRGAQISNIKEIEYLAKKANFGSKTLQLIRKIDKKTGGSLKAALGIAGALSTLAGVIGATFLDANGIFGS